jgi:hypothetical protein
LENPEKSHLCFARFGNLAIFSGLLLCFCRDLAIQVSKRTILHLSDKLLEIVMTGYLLFDVWVVNGDNQFRFFKSESDSGSFMPGDLGNFLK